MRRCTARSYPAAADEALGARIPAVAPLVMLVRRPQADAFRDLRAGGICTGVQIPTLR
jgi:hypothetical protein